MKNKILVSVSVVSLLAAIGSATALGWMYRKVRAFEKEHHVSIVTPAPAAKELSQADAGLQRGKVYESEEKDLYYVVQEGDDIVSIAIQFGVSPSSIMACNGLENGDAVKPDAILKLAYALHNGGRRDEALEMFKWVKDRSGRADLARRAQEALFAVELSPRGMLFW